MGRKPTYDAEALKPLILDWIAGGKTLRDFCRQPNMPKYSIIYEWAREDADFGEQFARARDIGADVIAEEILDIVDERPVDSTGVMDPSEVIAWQKNKAHTRLQLLAKWNPKKYGDQKKAVELSGPNGGPIETTIIDGSGLSDEAAMALAEALDEALYRSSAVDDPYVDEDEEGYEDDDEGDHE
jgi:hypothetical protein